MTACQDWPEPVIRVQALAASGLATIPERFIKPNTPLTYEGYGSRLGVKKGAILDWSDYFFLHYMPCSLRDQAKWPALPTSLRYVPPIIANVKKNIRMFWSLM